MMIAHGSDKKTWLLLVALPWKIYIYVGPISSTEVRTRKGQRAGFLKIEKKEDRFFIFTEFVEVEQCEIKGEKERKPDPESDLQLEL